MLHENFVPTAHFYGMKVHLWTINDPDEMRELIEDYDVDGIVTDYVADLDQVIRETSRD